ncbi:MAG: flavin reductase [Firmicutes bacterium]|nr:flavin reductase [Bacillota bacterium]
MAEFEKNECRIFEEFNKGWALVTAGNMEKFNGCTVSWGSMGTLWGRSVVTVYLHPSRYTTDFAKANEYFTVSFFPEEYRKALSIMGSKSGRDCDKVAEAGLTAMPCGDSVTYKEAKRTFLCRKLYQGKFDKMGLDPEIAELYRSRPQAFPPDENGDWQPHWIFVGQVVDVIE